MAVTEVSLDWHGFHTLYVLMSDHDLMFRVTMEGKIAKGFFADYLDEIEGRITPFTEQSKVLAERTASGGMISMREMVDFKLAQIEAARATGHRTVEVEGDDADLVLVKLLADEAASPK